MTNKEYKNAAQKILEECDELENDNYTITTISELFFLRLRKALLKYESKESSYTIAKELNNIQDVSDENDNTPSNKESDFNVSIYSRPEKVDADILKLLYFRILQFTVNSFPNIENILSGYGVENPTELIQKIKSVQTIKTLEDKEFVISIITEFEENEKLQAYFFLFSLYFSFKKSIFSTLRKIEEKDWVSFFKCVQYVGTHYKELYCERIAVYSNIFNGLDEYWDLHGDAILRLLDKFSFIYREYDFHKIRNFDIEEDLVEFSIPLVLDFCFLFYFLLHESSALISLSFFLMSDNMPLYLKDSIIKSFKGEKYYAPIIQYEYEWYCLKNDLHPTFPKLFYSGEPVDLNSFGIIDYDLYDSIEVSNEAIQSSNGNNADEPLENLNKLLAQDNNILVQIARDLDPYFVVFDKSASCEKGYLFKSKYLLPLITLSENIQDSLTVHGFTYILYKSHYFNWMEHKFTANFTFKIAQIFQIEDEIGTLYTENKIKMKAWDILVSNPELQGLLESSVKDGLKCYFDSRNKKK